MKSLLGCGITDILVILLMAGGSPAAGDAGRGGEPGGRDPEPVPVSTHIPSSLGQLVEGFGDIAPVVAGHSQRVNNAVAYFPRAKGADDTWGQLTAYWAIPGEEVTWLTAPCPQKATTTFAFAALLGRLNGYHELFVNSRYAITFTTASLKGSPAAPDKQASPSEKGAPVPTRWENGPYRLRFYPGNPEPGLAGIFYLTVPAFDVSPGQSVTLTVRPAVQDYAQWTPYGPRGELFIYWRGMPFSHGKGWRTLPELRQGFEFYFALKNIPTAWAFPIGPPPTGWFRAVTTEQPRPPEELELLASDEGQVLTPTPSTCLTRIEAEPSWDRATLQFPARPGEMAWVGVKEFRGEFAVLWNGLIGAPATGGSFLPYDHGWTEEKPYDLEVITGVGDPPDFFVDEVSRDFKQEKLKGYLPIVSTTWSTDGLDYRQEAVATLLDAEEVSTGFEPMVGLFRYRVTNPQAERKKATLWLSFNNLAYSLAPIPPRITANPPAFKGGLALKNNLLLDDRGRIRAAVYPGPGSSFSYLREFQPPGDAVEPWATLKSRNLLENTARFKLELEPGGSGEVLLKIPYFSLDPARQPALARLGFDSALADATNKWERDLAAGAQLSVPDEFLNRVWKAEQCNFLLTIDKERTTSDELEKLKTFAAFPPPVRASGRSLAKMSPGHYDHPHPVLIFPILTLDRMGHHEQAESLLQPFIDWHGTQSLKGIANWKGYTSTEGMWCVPIGEEGKSGYNYIPWGCQNGVIMWGMAEHYRLSADRAWLEAIVPKLIAGCDWIISQRRHTMQLDPQGRKPPHWGLMPKATWTDDPGGDYVIGFTDAYQYRGLRSVADVLVGLAHPEAERLVQEAAAYRKDILAALGWSAEHAPPFRITGGQEVPYLPASLYKLRPTLHPWHLVEVANLHLVEAGLLDAKDPLVGAILRAAEDVPACMSFGISTSEPFYSPQIAVYFRRDELDQMWQALYALFARGFSRNTLVGVEEQWGVWGTTLLHTLDFLRNALVWEDGGALRLGHGIPKAWLTDGKGFSLRGAPTWFGPVSLEVRSHLAEGLIEATVEPPTRSQPEVLSLRLRHPHQNSIQRVVVSGREETAFEGDLITLPTSTEKLEIRVFYEPDGKGPPADP